MTDSKGMRDLLPSSTKSPHKLARQGNPGESQQSSRVQNLPVSGSRRAPRGCVCELSHAIHAGPHGWEAGRKPGEALPWNPVRIPGSERQSGEGRQLAYSSLTQGHEFSGGLRLSLTTSRAPRQLCRVLHKLQLGRCTPALNMRDPTCAEQLPQAKVPGRGLQDTITRDHCCPGLLGTVQGLTGSRTDRSSTPPKASSWKFENFCPVLPN